MTPKKAYDGRVALLHRGCRGPGAAPPPTHGAAGGDALGVDAHALGAAGVDALGVDADALGVTGMDAHGADAHAHRAAGRRHRCTRAADAVPVTALTATRLTHSQGCRVCAAFVRLKLHSSSWKS